MARCSRARNSSASCTWARRPACAIRRKDPHSYIASNVLGTLNVLEGCRHHGVGHLVYASTSSVYGASTRLPFSVHEPASHPLSLYAASKRSTELMAHSYSSLFGLPTTGLRFFTVYGPWGRPDMALFRLRARSSMAGPSRSSTTATISATSPMSKTSPRGSCGSSTGRPRRSTVERSRPGSCHQHCAVSALQHRQPPPHRVAALY